MRKTSTLLNIAACIVSLTSLSAVEIGETKASVLDALGAPTSYVKSSSREILNYEKKIIHIADGLVKEVSDRPIQIVKKEVKQERRSTAPMTSRILSRSYVASPFSGIVVIPQGIELHPLAKAK